MGATYRHSWAKGALARIANVSLKTCLLFMLSVFACTWCCMRVVDYAECVSLPPPLAASLHPPVTNSCFVNPLRMRNVTKFQTADSVVVDIHNECSLMDPSTIDACSIPNVVHVVWYSGNGFSFQHFLSAKSIRDRLNPDFLFVHGLSFPVGNEHFDRAVRELDLIPVHSRNVKSVYNHRVRVVQHIADVVRLESLIRFGGMYFDLDVLIIRPLLHLFRDKETVLPVESNDGLNNGIILAKRCSRFLRRWYDGYTAFDDSDWGGSSIILPKRLMDEDSTGIVADRKYLKSDWPVLKDFMYSNDANPEFWNEAVAVHTFTLGQPEIKQMDENSTMTLRNNYGRLARNVMAGRVGF